MASGDSRMARDEMLREFEDLKLRFQSFSERLDAKGAKIRGRYRSDLDLMMNDRSVANRYLQSADASLRLLALETLADHWVPDAAYYDLCERLATDDPELIVRASALRRLGLHYANTSNSRILTLGAREATRNREHEWFARAAYRVFRIVSGIAYDHRKILSGPKPGEVDWNAMEPYWRTSFGPC